MSRTDCNCAALRQASRFLTRVYDDALAPLDLGINQFSILARLDRLGPLVLQELARVLVMDRSTVGHLLRPLEARGLVTLASGVEDGRCRVAALTAAGRALLAEARPIWAEAQARFERAFGAGEAHALRTALSSLVTLPADSLASDERRPTESSPLDRPISGDPVR